MSAPILEATRPPLGRARRPRRRRPARAAPPAASASPRRAATSATATPTSPATPRASSCGALSTWSSTTSSSPATPAVLTGVVHDAFERAGQPGVARRCSITLVWVRQRRRLASCSPRTPAHRSSESTGLRGLTRARPPISHARARRSRPRRSGCAARGRARARRQRPQCAQPTAEPEALGQRAAQRPPARRGRRRRRRPVAAGGQRAQVGGDFRRVRTETPSSWVRVVPV